MPRPSDFDLFWKDRMAEADAVGLDYAIEAASVTDAVTCQLFDLWYTGMCGARLHAKYLKPVSDEPVPLVLQFHGYPGASRSWFEQASFAGMGMALIALDCPGQGGPSEDIGGFEGTTVAGHIVAGIDGDPANLYYVRLHQDIRILCRIVRELEGIDLTRVYVNGASQGGGLGIATCALNSELINRAAILYPFLSDFRLVWDLDADDIATRVCAIGRVGLTRTRLVSRKPMPSWRTSIPRILPPWSSAPCCLARARPISSVRRQRSLRCTTTCPATSVMSSLKALATRRFRILMI